MSLDLHDAVVLSVFSESGVSAARPLNQFHGAVVVPVLPFTQFFSPCGHPLDPRPCQRRRGIETFFCKLVQFLGIVVVQNAVKSAELMQSLRHQTVPIAHDFPSCGIAGREVGELRVVVADVHMG
jgi:hypothetical protein